MLLLLLRMVNDRCQPKKTGRSAPNVGQQCFCVKLGSCFGNPLAARVQKRVYSGRHYGTFDSSRAGTLQFDQKLTKISNLANHGLLLPPAPAVSVLVLCEYFVQGRWSPPLPAAQNILLNFAQPPRIAERVFPFIPAALLLSRTHPLSPHPKWTTFNPLCLYPPPLSSSFPSIFPFPHSFCSFGLLRLSLFRHLCVRKSCHTRSVALFIFGSFFYGADFSHKLCPWKLDCDFYLPRCQSSVEFYEPGQPSLMRGAMNPFGHYGTGWQVTHHNGDRVWQPRVTRAEQIRGINKASIFADFANFCDTF